MIHHGVVCSHPDRPGSDVENRLAREILDSRGNPAIECEVHVHRRIHGGNSVGRRIALRIFLATAGTT